MAKKTKRTKLTLNSTTSAWNFIPTVIVAEALQKADWFKDKKIRFWDGNKIETAKKLYEKDGFFPRVIKLIQIHKEVKIEVSVEWLFEEERCEILLQTPNERLKPKQNKSKFVEGILDRAHIIFEDAIPIAEEEALKKVARETLVKEAEKYHIKLKEELGVDIDRNRQWTPYEYQYGKGREFGMYFAKTKNDTFEIQEIKGDFGIEEIKQLIKIIGGNPRAVASRLGVK